MKRGACPFVDYEKAFDRVKFNNNNRYLEKVRVETED